MTIDGRPATGLRRCSSVNELTLPSTPNQFGTGSMFSRGLSEYKPVSVLEAPSSEIRTFLEGRLLNIGDVGKLGLHLALEHIQACWTWKDQ